MSLTHSLAAGAVRTASAISPRWGSRIALPLFARVAPRRPIDSADLATMWRADRCTVRIPGVDRRGTDIAVYEWGPSGAEVVVLAHGWDGRASQFATVVRELVGDGYRVVAFDAPAHGDSPGRATYLLDWVHALQTVQERHGRFAAVVGHSFGGLAALVAVGSGVGADRVATVAAPADAEHLLLQFRTMLGFDARTADELRRRFARRYFPGGDDPFATLSPLRHPLPPGSRLLLVHDETDRVVPFTEAVRIAAAHPEAQLVTTNGLGHTRILRSDPFLDAVQQFLATPATPAGRSLDGRIARPEDADTLALAG
jgi:pimeloyl-ACP methyl ester carboxylesterase